MKRYHYMDAMRSTLMMLGVILHAAKIYDGVQNWHIEDVRSSAVFFWLVKAIHLFRMPAFFIISGFFTLLSLKKYGSRRFLQIRLQRLLIPLVATALLLNTLQNYACYRHFHADCLGLLFYLRHGLLHDWAHGEWVVHLWFLNNLIVYCLIATILYELRWIRRWLNGPWLRPLLTGPRREVWLLPVLALAPVALAVPDHFSPLFHRQFLGITSLYDMLEYLPFFLFGMWLYQDEKLQASFSQFRPWQLAVFAAALPLLWWSARIEHGPGLKTIFYFSHGLLVWLACLFCFALFRSLASQQSKLFLYLSDAAYTVYLFHHLCVLLLGLLLMHYAFSIFIKFTLVVAGTLVATLAIHHFLILRIGLLRFLFNGKWPAPAYRPAAAPAFAEAESETAG